MEYGDSAFAAINQFGGVDYAPHNKGITPVFFIEPVPDPVATEQAGHPVSRDMERVRLYIVGDSLSVATHPVDENIKRRFPEEYKKWKRMKTGADIKGMRLAEWPMATPAMIAELGGLHIYSVEDLAAVSDGNIQNIVNGREIRAKAVAWLAQVKDGAAVMKYAAENERLRDDLKEAIKRISALEKDTSRGRSKSQDLEVEAIDYEYVGDDLRDKLKEAERKIAALQKPAMRKAKVPEKPGRKLSLTPEQRAKIGARLKAARERRRKPVGDFSYDFSTGARPVAESE